MHRPRRKGIGTVSASLLWLPLAYVFGSAPVVAGEAVTATDRTPLIVERYDIRNDIVSVTLSDGAYHSLKTGPAHRTIAWPINATETLTLELERFEVTTPATRFVTMTESGPVALAAPEVVLFRGAVQDDPGSHAFLALSPTGINNGYVVTQDGARYVLSDGTGQAGRGAGRGITIHRSTGAGGMPDVPEVCGLRDLPDVPIDPARSAGLPGPLPGGPRVVTVAVDADQAFVQLFQNVLAAPIYVTQVIGAVSDIYMRDLDVRLVLGFSRVWPDGGEPFSADSLGGFRNYWENDDDPSPYNLIHLMSGRRDLPYGGVAYLSGTCNSFGYGISGFLLGSFPRPVDGPDLGNWDLTVSAHEMGHNLGTLHTHDGYSPPIDDCASGIHSRGTIMSYCHITAGGLLNIDMRLHQRVQEVIDADIAAAGCLWLDCNGNSQPDSDDIAEGRSDDANGNGIPDECDDCDDNDVLDSAEISGGAADVNGNGIPDICEPDCDNDGVPDEHQITVGQADDANGNLVPDQCEPDCDGNGVADHVQIAANATLDYDRNTILDSCQDCDGNGQSDWLDIDRQHNFYVADLADYIRDYHADSGVAVATLGSGAVTDPYDVVFGADRQLYVASYADDRIVRIDVDTGVTSDFVSAGVGGLDGPAGLIFGPTGNLFVSSSLTHSVIEYDSATGAPVGTFVASGAGGLTQPIGLTFGPGDNLFVTSANNSVLEFSGVDGSFVRTFVTSGSGGLNGPRGLAFIPTGNLVVASYNTNSAIHYDASGAPLGNFNGGYTVWGAWGVRVGPQGTVFVVRHHTNIRIIEFSPQGLYLRSFVRGDSQLTSPTGVDFRPASPNDCNGNRTPDLCDLTIGDSVDCQPNGVPDECDIASGNSSDNNGTGVPDECECLPTGELLPEDSGPCGIDDDCANAATCLGDRCYAPKNRYLSVDTTSLNPGLALAIRITHPSSGRAWWIDDHRGGDDPADIYRLSAAPFCHNRSDLPTTLHVGDCAITPDSTYEVQAIDCTCDLGDEPSFSIALRVPTTPRPNDQQWADCVGGFGDATWSPANGIVNFADVSASVQAFQLATTAPPLVWMDLHDEVPNAVVNFADINLVIKGFQNQPYPYSAPAACP